MKIKFANWEYLVGILGIVVTLLTAAAIVFYWDFIQALGAYGYAGAFVISAVGGATILAPIPMTPVVFALGGVLKPWFVGIAAGLGETIGGLAIYMTGYGGGAAFVKTKHTRIRDSYMRMMRWIEGKGSLTLFVLSATLNPLFYPAALAAGALRFNMVKFSIVCLVGKTIKGMVVAYAGFYGLRELLRWLGFPL